MEYRTENELVEAYIINLELEDYIGNHNPKDVIFLADSGYDDKRIEKAIIRKKWSFIISSRKISLSLDGFKRPYIHEISIKSLQRGQTRLLVPPS